MTGELRQGWLAVPEAYTPYDFLGAALGAYFLWDGVTGKGPNWMNIALGSIMVYIHTQRFFYAPQTQAGVERLLKSVGIKKEDLRL